jgi:hypothetical protein
VEGIRERGQGLAQYEEKKPREHYPERTFKETYGSGQGASASRGDVSEFFQTGGANDPVVVFCHTFAAEEAFAFRTESRRFAGGVVEATLVSKNGHDST